MNLLDAVSLLLKSKGREVYSVGPASTVYDALKLMAEKNVGALAVVSEGKLVGVISERDYARKVVLKGKASKETPVREIMSGPPVTVTPQDTVDACMKIMTDKRFRHLPVVEGGKLVGMLSIGDLVKWIITTQDKTIHELEDYISGKYPA